jgi:hypothetical protein
MLDCSPVRGRCRKPPQCSYQMMQKSTLISTNIYGVNFTAVLTQSMEAFYLGSIYSDADSM